jgi:hypothetical protein
MKHLKKYNESIDDDIYEEVFSYAKECFLEFYDVEEYDVEEEKLDDGFTIAIELPKFYKNNNNNHTYYGDINKFIKWYNRLNEFFQDVQVSINRFKDKYNNIEVLIEKENMDLTTEYIRLIFDLNKLDK